MRISVIWKMYVWTKEVKIGQNDHIPLFGKTCSVLPLFGKYFAIYHSFGTQV